MNLSRCSIANFGKRLPLAKFWQSSYNYCLPMNVVAQMKKFVEPKSVAVIGAPRSPMTIYGTVVDVITNLVGCGYQGKIYPIHPQASEIRGLKAYASITGAPEDIDLAVINLPRDSVPKIVKECVNKGIKAIIIITQGFADAGDAQGKQLQREIDDAIKGTGARIVGPNTFGTANAFINFSSSFWGTEMSKIPVGFMCQTGVFFVSLAGLKLVGKVIDLGNGSDVDFSDGLAYFEQDAETKVVGLHIEGMRDASRFLKQANKVACKKPVVVLKTGRSEQTVRAVQSHTGSLVGRDEIWDVALKQAGLIRVNDVEELGDTIRAFYTLPPMMGRKIGIVTWTGGFGIMGLDACQKSGLEASKLSLAAVNRLSALSPSWQDIGNPADIWPAVGVAKKGSLFEVLEIAMETFLNDPGVDAILCILGAFTPAIEINLCQLVEQMAKSHPDKPLVFYLYGPFANEIKNKLEGTGKTLVFPSPDKAVRALGHLADYSEFRTENHVAPV